MGSLDSNRLGLILRDFLVEPLNKRRFNAFYSVTYQFTFGYLRFLSYRGYRLTVDDRTGCDPVSDLAIDILGRPLSSEKGNPFHMIFAYFHAIGIDDFAKHDTGDLWNKFSIWLRRQIKQELSRLGTERNPQIGNLKRRFHDILKPPEYHSFAAPDNHAECVALAANCADLRRELSPLPVNLIREIAERAFLKSLNRSQWCRAIFDIQ